MNNENERDDLMRSRHTSRVLRVSYPGDMYDIFGGQLFYSPPRFTLRSTREAWAIDWENIAKAFQTAVGKLELEPAR